MLLSKTSFSDAFSRVRIRTFGLGKDLGAGLQHRRGVRGMLMVPGQHRKRCGGKRNSHCAKHGRLIQRETSLLPRSEDQGPKRTAP